MHDIARLWHTAAEQARRENADRAARVLAHPDLVERLTEPPASIREPHKWSGWIPPRTDAETSCRDDCGTIRGCNYTQHRTAINTSPVRRQLVEIAAEALRRENEQLETEQADQPAGQAE